MEIGAVTDLYAMQSSGASATGLENALKGVDAADDEKLMDVCKQFESYMLEQVYKEMLKTVSLGDDEASSVSGNIMDLVKDGLAQEIASQATEQQSLGLAQQLYDSMKLQYTQVPRVEEG